MSSNFLAALYALDRFDLAVFAGACVLNVKDL
jgi:hypothetical protein